MAAGGGVSTLLFLEAWGAVTRVWVWLFTGGPGGVRTSGPRVQGLGFRATHRLQYPLIQEYFLKHIRDPTKIYGIFLY